MPILTEDERVGTVLAGKYRVKSLLARGGMGLVFTGEHTWTGRSVAIKLLPPSHVGGVASAERFLREGRAATTLRHPHVVEVLDMGQADDGALFMALELLEGTDLERVRDALGPLDARTVVSLLTPIVDALATVHERGFVHRDLKPSNVFLAALPDGRVVPKLLDFGITKALEGEASATATGIIVGTPHYMAPEQASGEGDVGPPADVWALGVVLYQLLSGCFPYDAGSPTAILIAILQTTHRPLRDVAPSTPPAVADAVERLLARDPSSRPSDLRAWITQLRRSLGLDAVSLPLRAPLPVSADILARASDASAMAGRTTERPPPPRASAPRRDAARVWPSWLPVAGIAGALLVAAIAIALIVARRGEPEASPTAPTTPAVGSPGVAVSPSDESPAPSQGPRAGDDEPGAEALAVDGEPRHGEAGSGEAGREPDPIDGPADPRARPATGRIRRPTREEGDRTGHRPVAEITSEW